MEAALSTASIHYARKTAKDAGSDSCTEGLKTKLVVGKFCTGQGDGQGVSVPNYNGRGRTLKKSARSLASQQ